VTPESDESNRPTQAELEAENSTDPVKASEEISTVVEDWQEHNEELNYYIDTAGRIMSPEQLASAVDQYINNQTPEWRARHAELNEQLASAGEDYIAAAYHNRSAAEDREGGNSASEPELQIAVDAALRANPDLLNEYDVSVLLDVLEGPVGDTIARVHFEQEVIGGFSQLRTGSPEEIAEARAGIDSLRTEEFAKVFTESGSIDEWNATLDALDATLDAEDPVAAYNNLLANTDESALGFTFRSLGLAGINGNGIELNAAEQASLLNEAQLVTDGLTLTIGYPISRLNLPNNTISGVGLNGLSKLIGVASVGLAAYGLTKSIIEGDTAGIVFNGGALAGSVLAFIAPGPGTAIALGFAAASAIYNQANRVELSNRYTTLNSDHRENAFNFITHLDIDSQAAQALLDRSGGGHSAIPVFLKLGENNGWSIDQTLQHIDELQAEGKLDQWRDHYHRLLDIANGDVSQIAVYDLLNLHRPAPQPDHGHSGQGSSIRGGPHQDQYPDVHHPGMDGNGLPSTNG